MPKTLGQQQLWAQELLGKLKLRGDECLLDVGCGDGKVTAEIAAHLPRGRVVGVDLSLDMVHLAEERFAPELIPNLRFEQADASDLPFNEEFDVVFSNAVLHWVIDHQPGAARDLVGPETGRQGPAADGRGGQQCRYDGAVRGADAQSALGALF